MNKKTGKMGVCIELKNNNYGSMLQSYATQTVLHNYGIQFDLLDYKKELSIKYIVKNSFRIFNPVLFQDKLALRRKTRFINQHPEQKVNVQQRTNAFNSFRTNYFKASVVQFRGYENLKKGSMIYQSFFSGSDQLWSPSGLATNFYNLMFARNDAIKISYASSFGVKDIPWYQIGRTKKYLERIRYISCRENSGKSIVEKLTGKAVPVVVDPTLLFSANDWIEMLSCKTVYTGKYIFSYLLGTEKCWRDEVIKLSKATGLPILSIHQFTEADLNFGDVSIENAGPVEFVDLIRNADYICTDSFHGSVFSILFHKRFLTFNRYKETSKVSKNTRIDSLCSNLGLEQRRFSKDIVQEIEENIEYELVDMKLQVLREKSYNYLEHAFDHIS